MYDKTKVFPIREPEGGGGGGGDVTAAGNNTFTGVNTFENNVNLGKSDSIITVNGTLKDGGGNEYVTTTDVATKNSTGVVQIGDYIDVDENGVISSNDTRKASIEALKDGTLVPKLADNMTPYAEDSGTTQTQPFFLEGTATGNGESRVDAKQVPAYAFLQEKRGNMVCVNQLADCQTITTPIERNNISSQLFTYYPEHTYLCCFDYKIEANIGNIYFFYGIWNNSVTQYSRMRVSVSSLSGRFQLIFNPTQTTISDYSSVKIILQMLGTDISKTNKVTTSNVAFIDLTQWFNGNIPAYLLSHPEAFGRYYKGPLTYEPGRLEPATGRYLTSVGRNLYDGEHDVDVSPSTAYYCYGNATITYKDVDGNTLSTGAVNNSTFTTPANCYSLGIVGTDICISRYYGGESGYDQYYPHEVLATIDTGTEQLGFLDYKVPSGLITRATGSVDLGTLNWIYYPNDSCFYVRIVDGKPLDAYGKGKARCAKYPNNTSTTFSGMPDKTIDVGNRFGASDICSCVVKDSAYTDVASFKAAMSGVILYYELAEPATEQGTPFQENVPIDDFGQLSWSDTDVPQGNQIFYPVDYKAYEDTLIKYTDGDATSLVRNTDYASYNKGGVGKVDPYFGVNVANGIFQTVPSTNAQIKEGSYPYAPIVPSRQYRSVFYGLSRAAGVDLASSTEETAPDGTNPGVYPAAAKSAIRNLIGAQSVVEVVRLI